MKKQGKSIEETTTGTTQVNIRMRKDTVEWLAGKPNKKARTVPAKARQIIEAAQDADEQKKGG